MNATQTAAFDSVINPLFSLLEAVTKESKGYNWNSLYAASNKEHYSELFELTLEEIAALEKKIVRACLRFSSYGEIVGLVEAGTLPRFVIQAACRRNLQKIPSRFFHRSLFDTLSPLRGGIKSV